MGPEVFPTGDYSQELLGDNIGGSFSTWTQMAGSNQSSITQRITSSGEIIWGNGIAFSTNSSHFRTNPRTSVAEGSSEIMAAWTESNGGQSQRGVYAQRLDENGNRLWGLFGVPVVPLNTNYAYLDLSVKEFVDDMVAVYIEQSVNMSGDIYASRLNSNGEYAWSEQTVTLTTSGISKSDMMVEKGQGCLFVAWTENNNIYAHRLREDGILGAEDSFIIGDVNGDEIINVLDVILLVQMVLGNLEVNLESGDINSDGGINVLDVVQLVNIILNS